MRTFLVLVALMVLPTASTAQNSEPVAVFEAASVKRHPELSDGSFVGRQPGGRLTATAATLRELIEFAYLIQPFQLLDVPKWAEQDRWDVNARLATAPSAVPPGAPDATLLALRALLADRFRLVLRKEVRRRSIARRCEPRV